LIAEFKADIRAGLMKKKGQPAMQLELILEEKKFTTGTNRNYNGNTKQAVLINEVEDEEVDDIKRCKWVQRSNYNHNYQNTRKSYQNKCTFCHKSGHQIDICFIKFPALRNQSSP
jgi:hypothetical protein